MNKNLFTLYTNSSVSELYYRKSTQVTTEIIPDKICSFVTGSLRTVVNIIGCWNQAVYQVYRLDLTTKYTEVMLNIIIKSSLKSPVLCIWFSILILWSDWSKRGLKESHVVIVEWKEEDF